jgi:hypothetical protein
MVYCPLPLVLLPVLLEGVEVVEGVLLALLSRILRLGAVACGVLRSLLCVVLI